MAGYFHGLLRGGVQMEAARLDPASSTWATSPVRSCRELSAGAPVGCRKLVPPGQTSYAMRSDLVKPPASAGPVLVSPEVA